VIALLSLLPWPAILWVHLARFRYPDGAGRWLGAFGAWGSLLVVTAFVSFLPGVLERWKFTNALVAHAHLAMAGMMTSFVALVLIALGRGTPLAGVLAAPVPFALWHFGCLVYVVSMLLLGTLEGIDPGIVIRGAPTSTGLYAFRWIGGAMMLAASIAWWSGARRRLADPIHQGGGTA
jgi:cytochrome c oxidase cbb3-type subunit 1